MSERLCAVAIMAKASVAGVVKTRLVPPLTLEEAAELNSSFLADVAANIAIAAAKAPIQGFTAYHPCGSERFFAALLPDGFKLEEIDYSFPEDTLGVVVCLTHDDKVSHILVQHPRGMYDAGYFDGDPSYTYRPLKTERDMVAGNVSSRKVKTTTMSFSFDVDFNAAVK